MGYARLNIPYGSPCADHGWSWGGGGHAAFVCISMKISMKWNSPVCSPARRAHRRPAPSHVNTLHMRWSRHGGDPGSGPRSYHHGNLKEALLRAALELIAQKGTGGFTFAEAARSAGVSPAAPYRHFRDRDELLANVAMRGFEQFEASLARAWEGGKPSAFSAFERVGKAYLAFARAEPAYYSAMFESGLALDAYPEPAAGGRTGFRRAARGHRSTDCDATGEEPPAGPDDGAACAGALSRHCLAVRTRGRRTPRAADGAGGIAGGRRADLSARPRVAESGIGGSTH